MKFRNKIISNPQQWYEDHYLQDKRLLTSKSSQKNIYFVFVYTVAPWTFSTVSLNVQLGEEAALPRD